MLPNDRAQPAAQNKPSWGHRLMHAYRRAPTWLLAAAVLGWRVAKGMQDARMYGGRDPRAPADPRAPGSRADQHPAGNAANAGPAMPGGRPGGHPGAPTPGVRAQAAALPYADYAARDHQGAPRPRPPISVENAMAELDAMIGLGPVKEQVRSIAASI